MENISDDPDQADAMKGVLKNCFKFINLAIKAKKAACVHCAAGISRSSTIVIAYLMSEKKLSLFDAFSLVRK
jgi:protein-tyrosine phosphatase